MAAALILKKEVQQALRDADFERVARLALENRKVLGILISLSFDKDDVLCWRAIEAMGIAAAAVAKEQDPAIVRNMVRRIIWSAREESGGMGWSAPELLGEIVHGSPRAFTDIPSIIFSLHTEDEEGVFLKGVLRALARMAEVDVGDVDGAHELVLQSLDDDDPRTRGLAVLAAAGLDYSDAVSKLEEMSVDAGRFLKYENGALVDTTVGDEARAALAGLS